MGASVFYIQAARDRVGATSGSMGYGLPAAIAAKLRYPGRLSVCFAGDGCFLMYPQELATRCSIARRLL